MKLLYCNIFGFGKICSQKFVFDEGLNVFCEENGFGKSTLASFIKVMLYGFEDESKRSLKDKEREKYRPWNRGLYGGNLAFEYNSKGYEVSRTFGKNETDDTFEVRDILTNTVTDIFDKNNMGAQIFGIDKESFFRTVYIASSDLNKRDEKVTDSIRAKLGNLTDATDDINNFETACARLEKKLNELTPDRRPGKIKSLRSDIAEKSNEYRKLEDTEKATEIIENQIQAQIKRIESDNVRKNELKKDEQRVLRAESLREKKKQYDFLKAEFNEVDSQVEEIKSFFAGSVPEHSAINSVKEKCIDMKHCLAVMDENRFEKDDKWMKMSERFKDGICTENEVRVYLELWDDTVKKKTDMDNKQKKLAEDAMNFIDEAEEHCKEEYDTGLRYYKKREKSRKAKAVIFTILAILSLGSAAALTVFGIMGMRQEMILLPEVILFVIGLVFVLLIVVMKLYKKERFTLKETTGITYEEAVSKVDSTAYLRNSIKESKEDVALAYKQIGNFFEKFSMEFEEDKVTERLFTLLEESKEYMVLKDKLNRFESAKKTYEEKDAEVSEFFASIGRNRDPEGGDEALLDDFSERSVRYSHLVEQRDRKKINVVQFETENDIKEICEEIPENLPDVDDIREEIEEIDEELAGEKDNLSSFRKRLEIQQEERDRLIALGVSIEEDKEKLAGFEENYKLMQTTLEYLGRAKNSLALKYTAPTMEGFKKYSACFEGEDPENFKIDTNLNLTKTEEGMQRRIGELSLGLREVTDFCLRLALADAMYDKEKPFLILDDPFVNFDEKNLEGAKKVLNMISNESQVLYFTCHDSRKL
ncbi:MAG: hypothetical protein K5776_05155 [Lachnospiraceae bacterium]|nr:hypothetical protein [Lachnospiraceae bacterium]